MRRFNAKVLQTSLIEPSSSDTGPSIFNVVPLPVPQIAPETDAALNRDNYRLYTEVRERAAANEDMRRQIEEEKRATKDLVAALNTEHEEAMEREQKERERLIAEKEVEMKIAEDKLNAKRAEIEATAASELEATQTTIRDLEAVVEQKTKEIEDAKLQMNTEIEQIKAKQAARIKEIEREAKEKADEFEKKFNENMVASRARDIATAAGNLRDLDTNNLSKDDRSALDASLKELDSADKAKDVSAIINKAASLYNRLKSVVKWVRYTDKTFLLKLWEDLKRLQLADPEVSKRWIELLPKLEYEVSKETAVAKEEYHKQLEKYILLRQKASRDDRINYRLILADVRNYFVPSLIQAAAVDEISDKSDTETINKTSVSLKYLLQNGHAIADLIKDLEEAKTLLHGAAAQDIQVHISNLKGTVNRQVADVASAYLQNKRWSIDALKELFKLCPKNAEVESQILDLINDVRLGKVTQEAYGTRLDNVKRVNNYLIAGPEVDWKPLVRGLAAAAKKTINDLKEYSGTAFTDEQLKALDEDLKPRTVAQIPAAIDALETKIKKILVSSRSTLQRIRTAVGSKVVQIQRNELVPTAVEVVGIEDYPAQDDTINLGTLETDVTTLLSSLDTVCTIKQQKILTKALEALSYYTNRMFGVSFGWNKLDDVGLGYKWIMGLGVYVELNNRKNEFDSQYNNIKQSLKTALNIMDDRLPVVQDRRRDKLMYVLGVLRDRTQGGIQNQFLNRALSMNAADQQWRWTIGNAHIADMLEGAVYSCDVVTSILLLFTDFVKAYVAECDIYFEERPQQVLLEPTEQKKEEEEYMQSDTLTLYRKVSAEDIAKIREEEMVEIAEEVENTEYAYRSLVGNFPPSSAQTEYINLAGPGVKFAARDERKDTEMYVFGIKKRKCELTGGNTSQSVRKFRSKAQNYMNEMRANYITRLLLERDLHKKSAEEYKSQLESKDTNVAEAITRNSQLQKEINDLQLQNGELTSKGVQVETERNTLQQKYDSLKADLEALRSTHVDFQTRCIKELSNQKTDYETKIAHLQRAHSDQVAKMESEAAQKNETINVLNITSQGKEKIIEGLKKDKGDLVEKNKKLESELATCRADLVTKEDLAVKYSNENETLRTQIANLKTAQALGTSSQPWPSTRVPDWPISGVSSLASSPTQQGGTQKPDISVETKTEIRTGGTAQTTPLKGQMGEKGKRAAKQQTPESSPSGWQVYQGKKRAKPPTTPTQATEQKCRRVNLKHLTPLAP